MERATRASAARRTLLFSADDLRRPPAKRTRLADTVARAHRARAAMLDDAFSIDEDLIDGFLEPRCCLGLSGLFMIEDCLCDALDDPEQIKAITQQAARMRRGIVLGRCYYNRSVSTQWKEKRFEAMAFVGRDRVRVRTQGGPDDGKTHDFRDYHLVDADAADGALAELVSAPCLEALAQ